MFPIFMECVRFTGWGSGLTVTPSSKPHLAPLPGRSRSPSSAPCSCAQAGRWDSRREDKASIGQRLEGLDRTSFPPQEAESYGVKTNFFSSSRSSPQWSLSLSHSPSLSSGSLAPLQPPHLGVCLSRSPPPPACLRAPTPTGGM